jgi:hypothetical protein
MDGILTRFATGHITSNECIANMRALGRDDSYIIFFVETKFAEEAITQTQVNALRALTGGISALQPVPEVIVPTPLPAPITTSSSSRSSYSRTVGNMRG